MLLCVLLSGVLGASEANIPFFGNFIPVVKSIADNFVFQNKCMGDLGCFYTGPPFFHPVYRPISLTPADNLNTKFILFTPTNRSDGQTLEGTEVSLQKSSFDPKLPIKVLIGGYKTDLKPGDIRSQIKDALLNSSRYNVIIVDWSESNGPPYPQAVANARAVGAQVANLLKFIMKTRGVGAKDIHLIGHSLGGHVVGYAGERITNLGRITGLDPANPYFEEDVNSVRLDITDAVFLDVIHTNGAENYIDGRGLIVPIGHMDFYPNGGVLQPGCVHVSNADNVAGQVTRFFTGWITNSCDHDRSMDYFLESIDDSECRFLATWCNSYDDFEKGECQNSTLAEMGLHAKRINGVPVKSKFFLRTNDASPFCCEKSDCL